MKALVWCAPVQGESRERPRPQDPQPPRRDRADHLHLHLRVRPAPRRRVHPVHEARRHPRPRADGHRRGGRPGRGQEQGQGRRPRRRPVPHRLRQLLLLPPAALQLLRQHQPQGVHRRGDVRPGDGRHLRLLAPDRRVRRRAGRVPPRAARRRQLPGDAAGPAPTTSSSSSPTSSRPATWPCSTATSSRTTRSPIWGCGPVGQFTIRDAPSCWAPARSSRSTTARWCPSACRWPRDAGAITIDNRSDESVYDRLHGPDRRHRPGRLHRRGRHGGPRLQRCSRRSTTRSRPT